MRENKKGVPERKRKNLLLIFSIIYFPIGCWSILSNEAYKKDLVDRLANLSTEYSVSQKELKQSRKSDSAMFVSYMDDMTIKLDSIGVKVQKMPGGGYNIQNTYSQSNNGGFIGFQINGTDLKVHHNEINFAPSQSKTKTPAKGQ